MPAASTCPGLLGEAGGETMSGIVCMFCNRKLDEHSHDTRDICNHFLPVDDLHPPVRGGEGDAGGARPAGVASGDAPSQEDIRGTEVTSTKSAPPILTPRLCHSGERLPSSDAAVGGADTEALLRRIGWLKFALYNIEIGRCHDAREHAHLALWQDDLISGKNEALEKNRLAIEENRRVNAMLDQDEQEVKHD
jgi:hypothetical protein